MDDTRADGTQTMTISASAAGYAGDYDTLEVTDAESPKLILSATAPPIPEDADTSSPEGTAFRETTLAGQSFGNSVDGFPSVPLDRLAGR